MASRDQQNGNAQPDSALRAQHFAYHGGLLFMQHGLVKLFGFPTGAGFPAFLSQTWFEGCIEMIGGGLIAIGLGRRSLRRAKWR